MLDPVEFHRQADAAAKWRFAQQIVPILKGTLKIAEGVEFSQEQFDFAVDAIENYLPKAISNSDLSESAQVEFLSMISLEGRRRDLLRNPNRRKQLIAICVWVMDYGIRVLEFLKVTVNGIPVRAYLSRAINVSYGATTETVSIEPHG